MFSWLPPHVTVAVVRIWVLLRTLVRSFVWIRCGRPDDLVAEVFRGGAVCTKIAQWASQRRGLMSDECRRAMQQTCMEVPPHPHRYTLKVLRRNGLLERLSDLEPTPLGSGSIAQVIRGVYDGQPCVIKVVHPGVSECIKLDTSLLQRSLDGLSRVGVSSLRAFDMNTLLTSIADQADLRIEAKNTRALARCFRTNPHVVFADILYESADVLVETYVPGAHLPEFVHAHPSMEEDAKSLALACYIEMFLVHGIIHADCHYGNIKYSVDATNRVVVGFLDCGVVSRISSKKRRHIIDCITYMSSKDSRRLAGSVEKLSKTRVDKPHLRRLVRQKLLNNNRRSTVAGGGGVGLFLSILLEVLIESRTCVDGDIISFIVGFLVLEGSTRPSNSRKSMTRLAIEYMYRHTGFERGMQAAIPLVQALNNNRSV